MAQTIYDNNNLRGYTKSTVAAGTAYALTNTAAALDFGTTDPAVTLDQPGTYLIVFWTSLEYNGASFAADRTVTMKLRRTNNTAADLTAGSTTAKTGVVVTLSQTFGGLSYGTTYTTTASDDVITIFGDVSTVPTAGSLDVVAAKIMAVKVA